MTAKHRRKWMATAAILAGLCASSYFWWWKPVVLASLRLALEGAIARHLPQASFGALDLAGIQTVVVHDLSYGKPQDDFSLVVPEARFTFSFWHLATGKLDPVSSLSSVRLIDPQVILTLESMGPGAKKGAESGPAYPAFPLPAQAQMVVKNGRILLRSRAEKSGFVGLTDMDADIIFPSPDTAMFDARFTSPESPRRGVSIQGVLSPSGLVSTVSLKKLRLTPLAPWIRRFNPLLAPEMGAVSCSITFSVTRTGEGLWVPSKTEGKLELDGVALSGPALPFRLREITGAARFSGNSVRITRLALLAPETPWKISGSVDNLAAPVLHITAEAPVFEPGKYLKGAEGHGALSIKAEGPAANPSFILVPEITGFRAGSFACNRLDGRFTVGNHGKRVLLEPGRIETGSGVASAWGTFDPDGPGASLRWTFTPGGTAVPAWSGTASLGGNVLNTSAKSADGIWTVTGRAAREKEAWNASVAGHSKSGALVTITARTGLRAPFRLSGEVTIRDALLSEFNITRYWNVLKEIEGKLGATGRISGTASSPVLALVLDGKKLALNGEKLPITGNMNISAESIQIEQFRLGQYASASAVVPLGNAPVEFSGAATAMPLRIALAIAGAPADAGKTIGGTMTGSFSGVNPGGKDGKITASLLIPDFTWKGSRLGALNATGEARGRSFRFSKLGLTGPQASAEGTGTLELQPNGNWEAGSTLTVNYLKYGQSDLECLAKVAVSSRDGTQSIEARLTSVRISGTAYPDADLSLKSGPNGSSSAKLSWEDLAYISITLDQAPENTVTFSVALSDFPLAPAAGLFSIPAPADRVSGSISLKGPRNRAVSTASLKWGHGEADARGWINCETGKDFSLSLNAVDGNLAPWVALIRATARPGNLPDLDGRLETRGLTLDKTGESLSINGWLSARELRVGGILCGDGSLRVTSSGAQSEFEATLDGPRGKYTVYPTRFIRTGDRRTLEGAFAWSGVPVAKARSSLSRAEIKAAWTDDSASANISLAGLALEDRILDKTFVHLDRKGNKWRLSSPKESPWQVIGTVIIAGTRVTVDEDERTGGAAVLVRGGSGVSVKAGGIWAPPAAPEEFSFEAHRLPASPLFTALGIPPTGGTAEADLDWKEARNPPLSGRLTLLDARWGSFLLDSVDARISGTPGRSFTLTSLRMNQGTDFSAKGTGEMVLSPEQSIKLEIAVEKLVLRYLKPLGFLTDSDSTASGKITVSGTTENPRMEGSLTCTPGTVKPRTAFSSLYLTQGRLDFSGERATLNAVLNDITGAAVLVNGTAALNKLAPSSFTLALSLPQPVKVDALPGLFKGSAHGSILFEGTPEEPILRGKLMLEKGQLRTPAPTKKGTRDPLAERMSWDIAVGFGKGVQYVVGAPLGAEIELAELSPRSQVTIRGKGADFKVTGEVLADSGPFTLFLGKQLWKK